MKITIAGAGISGAYMYRLLDLWGHDVTIFDIEHKTNCGINPCAWGTSKGFEDLVKKAGLNSNDYILRRFDHVWLDEIKIKAYMLTIDKPKLIKDLLGGAEIKYTLYGPSRHDYDRIIDATGVSRAFLPLIDNDLISPCYQYRRVSNEPAEMHFKVSKIGYAWSFPLSDKEFHVGAGSLVMDPIKILKDMDWLPKANQTGVKCACCSKVRQTAPRGSRPFVHENVWGIGEAIGCVAPMLGDGIIHGMRSAWFLLDNIDSPADYERTILREFAWMEKEREVVERLRSGKSIGLGSALVLQRNTRRMDIKLGLWDAFRLLRRATK
ncbi:MAG: hypothetical protein V1854_03630 [Methanobacteriota archaeon]